jgi:two-component system, probable response regulator PhcQ
MPHKVLFVDDEPNVTAALKRALREQPFEVLTASSAKEALQILASQPVDVVVSDEQMPGMSGADFLARVCSRYPDTIRMILTGHASLESAVRAINLGEIYRFFTKPCNETDLAITIRQALEQRQLIAERGHLTRLVNEQYSLLKQLERISPGITTVRKDPQGGVIIEDPGTGFNSAVQDLKDGKDAEAA